MTRLNTILLLPVLSMQCFQAFGFQSALTITGGRPSATTLTTPLTRQNYATTADLPMPSSSPSLATKRAQFDQRMRELVQKQEEQRRQQQEQEQLQQRRSRAFGKRPAFLKEVSTLQEFEQVVLGETERMTVVRFYQPSCRSCKAATPAFDAIAKKHPELNWVEVPVTRKNADLHAPLGLKTVPYGHIYIPEIGLVEEMKMGRPKIAEFEQILDAYVEGQMELQDMHPVTGIYTSPMTASSDGTFRRTAVAL